MTPEEKLDVVLSKLERVRPNAKGYLARCPAHEDKEPSLSVAVGERWIVFHCFAGCNPDDIVHKAGLTWADFVLTKSEPTMKRRNWRSIELEAFACTARLQNEPQVLERLRFTRGWAAKALELLDVGWDGQRLTLPVRLADGKLHDVLRYDSSAARRKILAGKGKSRLPWPSPESQDTDVLFLVEGEGTAISMHSVGLKAVALPGSISLPTTSVTRPGSWRGTGWHKKWAERFTKFRSVIIFPDCDGQGRALAGAASYDLRNAGVNVSIVDLGPKIHDGSDVGDILLKRAYDTEGRRAAKEILREIVAEEAEVLVA